MCSGRATQVVEFGDHSDAASAQAMMSTRPLLNSAKAAFKTWRKVPLSSKRMRIVLAFRR